MKAKPIYLITITLVVLALLTSIADHIASPTPAHAATQFANIICDNFKPFNATANVQVITAGNANMFIYVCAINVGPVGAADNVALVEGTGATCGTNTAGMAGGATAATGWNIALNGGIAFGSGQGAVMKTAVAGDNVCLLVSSAGPAAGVISWTASAF